MYVERLSGNALGSSSDDFVIVQRKAEVGDHWIAPLHVHHSDDEAWYVLEGVLRFRTGDEVFEAGPNGAVLAPKRTPHAYGNARRGEPARYVLVMTPKIRALVQALHQPGAGDYAANFATLILLSPSSAIAVTATAGLIADLLFRRRAWYQALFNSAACALTVAAASLVFSHTGGMSSSVDAILSPLNAVPLLLSGLTYFLLNTWLVSGVVALHRREAIWTVWRTSFAFSYELVGAVVLKLLGYLFAILFLTWGYMSAFLAVIATYFIRDAYMRYVAQTEAAARPAAPAPDRRPTS